MVVSVAYYISISSYSMVVLHTFITTGFPNVNPQSSWVKTSETIKVSRVRNEFNLTTSSGLHYNVTVCLVEIYGGHG